MIGCPVNKITYLLSISFTSMMMLLLNNLTSSNSDFRTIGFFSSMCFYFTEILPTRATNYGIIIDAGSTGSRLFLYQWTSRSDKELIDIRTVLDDNGDAVIRKVTPGLSSFEGNPEAAPEYIMPLLEFASEHIPVESRKNTPVLIFATAGMRLLPIEKQDLIMQSLREKLPKLSDLKVLPKNIKVIPGKWEGIYSWIAVNYMLGRFNLSNLPDFTEKNSRGSTKEQWVNERPKTAGMIDMGGASAQIAFELPMGDEKNDEEDGNTEVVNLGCRDEDKRYLYRIFVTTFLGFGVNEGAKKYEKFLFEKLEEKERISSKNESTLMSILDGCLPVNFLKLTSVEEEDQQFVRKGDGNWDQCVEDIAKIIFDDHPKCPVTRDCFFGGIKTPPGISLSQIELYGFSEYWFSVEDILSLGGLYDHDKFEAKAKEFCHQTWKSIKKKVRAKLYPKADHERLETQCFKSAWIHAILHNGFYVDDSRNHFQSAFRINGQEVQWALGAMIYQMRYFPLRANNGNQKGNDADQRNVNERLDAGNVHNWSTFYVICIVILLVILAKFWFHRHRTRAQTNGKKYFHYTRLDRQTSNDNSL